MFEEANVETRSSKFDWKIAETQIEVASLS